MVAHVNIVPSVNQEKYKPLSTLKIDFVLTFRFYLNALCSFYIMDKNGCLRLMSIYMYTYIYIYIYTDWLSFSFPFSDFFCLGISHWKRSQTSWDGVMARVLISLTELNLILPIQFTLLSIYHTAPSCPCQEHNKRREKAKCYGPGEEKKLWGVSKRYREWTKHKWATKEICM